MTDKTTPEIIHPTDLEQASNSYLMAIVAVIAGLPLPVINAIASLIYYAAHRQSSYFVRWHCIQAILAQAIMIPFNSFAFGWAVALITSHPTISFINLQGGYNGETDNFIYNPAYFLLYITIIILFNIAEFITVIITAARVRKGKNVRWFVLANLTDALTSKQNRDPYVL